MKINMKQWLEDVKNSNVKKAMPILSFPSVQLIGCTVKEITADANLQAKGMKMVADKTNSLASVSLMDLSVEAECFGSQICVSENEVPNIIGKIVEDMDSAKALKVPEVGSARSGVYIDAIKKATDLITDRPIFAGVIGPCSLAARLLDVSEMILWCYDDPEMVHLVLKKSTEFLIEYCKAYKAAGANGVVMAEPVAGLLSPDMAEEFSSPYVKQIVDAVQDDDFIVVYHNCGNNVIAMIDSILSTGSAAYHFGNSIDMSEMMKYIPDDTIAMGNVDPTSEFCNGTVDSITKATTELLDKCSTYKNFVISSGCDIPPHSKWENITAFFDAVDKYYES
ncbi:MAG: uroporphyrinogen decarboxylase family protein [Clostridia bacterium]|nr:uroporphyrinogen decarboxylase family protein [Clostridia bacterium]